MSCYSSTFLLLHLLIIPAIAAVLLEVEVVGLAREGLIHARAWAQGFNTLKGPGRELGALADCVELYGAAERRLARLLERTENWGRDDDAVTWLSAALASHGSCLDGLREIGRCNEARRAENLSWPIRRALGFYAAKRGLRGMRKAAATGVGRKIVSGGGEGLLTSWNAAASNADAVVAQDGSGNYKTINEAVSAIVGLGENRPERAVIYVKSGVYEEKVEIGWDLRNVMFVGDGMDKTVVTGGENVQDGATTLNSATFGVSGDGFWARDMTFENTAGPEKHQAVALRVASDRSVFYRCSFKGYQDTLLVHSLRQFYRDCQIYGTVDFIFGDAAAVFQNCDVLVRRPMEYQFNAVTAQGRDDPNENTGIAIVNSRVAAAGDFGEGLGFESYLGRPWKMYSRTVVMKTDLGGLVDGRGWKEWRGDFGVSTLYYAEYLNTGNGSGTGNRVSWPGFHVLTDSGEAGRFTAGGFIDGEAWIPATGVPFGAEL